MFKKKIRRPLRIFTKGRKPYIIYKDKKYNIKSTEIKDMLKFINKLHKKTFKKVQTDKKQKKNIRTYLNEKIKLEGGPITTPTVQNIEKETFLINKLNDKIETDNKIILKLNDKIDIDKKKLKKLNDNLKAIQYKENEIQDIKDNFNDLILYDENEQKYIMENNYIQVEGLTKSEVRKNFNEAFNKLYSEYRFNIDKSLKQKEEAENNLELSQEKLNQIIEEKKELDIELNKAKNINLQLEKDKITSENQLKENKKINNELIKEKEKLNNDIKKLDIEYQKLEDKNNKYEIDYKKLLELKNDVDEKYQNLESLTKSQRETLKNKKSKILSLTKDLEKKKSEYDIIENKLQKQRIDLEQKEIELNKQDFKMNLQTLKADVLKETFINTMGFKPDNKEAKTKYNNLFNINENIEEVKKKPYLTTDQMIKYIIKTNDIKDLEAEKKYNEELKLKENKEDKQYKEIIEDVKDIKKEFKEDKLLIKEQKRKAFEEQQKKETSGLLGYFKKKKEYISESEPEEENILEEEKSYNQGDGKNNFGLWNYQIDKIMLPFKLYIKTISLNELDDIIKYIYKNNILIGSFILNIGNHWTAIYFDFEKEFVLEYYDPFGEEPKNIIIQSFKNLILKYNIEVFVKFKINKIQQQNIKSSNCGWFSMYFLIMRYNNYTFKYITKFKDVKTDEKHIEDLKNKYDKFGFI